MKFPSIVFLLSIVFISSLEAQKVDSVYKEYGEAYKALYDQLDLLDFNTPHEDPRLRYRNNGQVLEMVAKGDSMEAWLINYVFEINPRTLEPLDIVFEKLPLDTGQTEVLKNIFRRHRLYLGESQLKAEEVFFTPTYDEHTQLTTLELQWGSKGAVYAQGMGSDSVFFRSSEQNYSHLIADLESELSLSSSYLDFMYNLPKKPHYYKGEGMERVNYDNEVSLSHALMSSSQFTLGYELTVYIDKIRRSYPNLSIAAGYSSNFNGQRDVSAVLGKGTVLTGTSYTFNDLLSYQYQNRRFQQNSDFQTYVNNTVVYSVSWANLITVGTGVDFLSAEENEVGTLIQGAIGPVFGNFSVGGYASFFENRVDRSLWFSKFVDLKGGYVGIGLAFENFKGFNDRRLSLIVEF